MRLTRKVEFGYENESKEITECSDKLGQLEDIEDELGIDLITLFKALTGPIWIVWYFEDKRYVRESSPGCLRCFNREKLCDMPYSAKIWGLDIGGLHYKLSDYGKTWALTKEELL